MSDIENKLIEKSIEGDVESFELLISSYQKYIYNVAYRMMGNEEDAKDMAQESLIKVYKNMNRFEKKSKFSTWIYRITINTCNDELRKRKSFFVSIDEESTDKKKALELEDNSSNPLIVYEQKEVKARIESAITKLPMNGREVIILKDVEGYSYDEISNILDIPIGTVRSRLNRSRKTLCEILTEELEYKVKGGIS